MNRIAGILNLDQAPVHARELDRMIEAQKYQRDDEQKSWVHGELGLGCTRIGNIGGKQHHGSQAVLPPAQAVIVFDGRIDNRQELLAVLRLSPSESSDEELVLAAYEKWDLGCPKHLVGDFAFAIWDNTKHRLMCARDHFGVKPFYYSCFTDCFVFASTPLAILASGKVAPVIHEERIADFLMELGGRGLEAVDKSSTFYTDVFRLPPAHRLIIQAGGITVERYWELRPVIPPGLRTEQDYIEAFRELFAQSVRCRLHGINAPASMLSGGMDSSAIVGMGRNVLAEEGRRLRALAFVSNCTSMNRETSHITSVLHPGNVQPYLVSQTELTEWMDELVKAVEGEAEPFDCLMNLNRAVYLRARDAGIRTLLDGVDGDLLLSNSFYIPALWKQGAFWTILTETLKADGLTAEYKMGRHLLLSSLLSTLTLYVPGWLRQVFRQRRNCPVIDESVEESIIDREFAIRSKIEDRIARLDSYSILPASLSQITAHKIDLDHPNLPAGLERYERVASAFGLEARHPLLDIRLAEFCLGLPWQWKTRGGWTKVILRRAMEPYLPSEVIWRKDKDSLMWEVNRLILKERAEYFYQITCDEQSELKTYIDINKLMKFWQEYLARGEEKHAELIWSGAALAMWLQRNRNMK